MKEYLEIIRRVLNEGRNKENRTGIDTIAAPNIAFSHNMWEGFPLLTTKRMPPKTIAVELEGFIGGITDKRWYQERGCKIWNEWANPDKVKIAKLQERHDYEGLQKELQMREHCLGPIYGYQWRRFNSPYILTSEKLKPLYGHYSDQFANIVHKLKTNPNDRRLVCSAWNPVQIKQMALPPCHIEFVLTHIQGMLHLHWTQRSCDLMLGVPFNIASYGLLLTLLAKEANLQAGNLSATFCDCHIYENQISMAYEQLNRTPRALPFLKITDFDSIFSWTHKDIELKDYTPLEKIDFGAVAV